MVAEGDGLLAAVAAAGGRVTARLDDGAVDNDVQIALFAVVVV